MFGTERTSVALLLSLAFFSVTVVSCDSSGSSTEPEEDQEFGSLEGTVIQADTESPVSGVKVSVLADKDTLSSTTGSEGNYSINRVPTGRHTLRATKSDYETYNSEIGINENETSEVDINVTPSIESSTLTGTVRSKETEEGVEGVKVKIAGQEDFTDSNGDYQVNNVPQGTKDISANKEGYISFEGEVFLSSNNKEFDIEIRKGSILDSNVSDTTIAELYSPVYVTKEIVNLGGSVNIESNVEFKIEEGVKINIEEGADVKVNGSPNNEVIFESKLDEPYKGSWGGIEVNGEISLKYANIKHANKGVHYENNNCCSIEGVLFERNKKGISNARGGGSILKSEFRNNNAAINVSDFSEYVLRGVVAIDNEIVIERTDGYGNYIRNSISVYNSKFVGNNTINGEDDIDDYPFRISLENEMSRINEFKRNVVKENESELQAVVFSDGPVEEEVEWIGNNFISNDGKAFNVAGEWGNDRGFEAKMFAENYIYANNGETSVDTSKSPSAQFQIKVFEDGDRSRPDCGTSGQCKRRMPREEPNPDAGPS